MGALPDIYTELEISYFLLRRLLGVRTEGDKKGAKVRGGWGFLLCSSKTSDYKGLSNTIEMTSLQGTKWLVPSRPFHLAGCHGYLGHLNLNYPTFIDRLKVGSE